MNFSANEKKFIIAYHLACKDAEKVNGKAIKAKIYRDVFNKPELGGVSATNSANKILKKFQKLPKEKQDIFLQEVYLKEEGEKLKEQIETVGRLAAYNKGADEARKEFTFGLEAGEKKAKNEFKEMLSRVDFSTEARQINFLEGFTTLLLNDYESLSKISYFDDESRKYISNAPVLASIINALVDVSKLNFQRFQKSEEYMNKMLALKKKVTDELN